MANHSVKTLYLVFPMLVLQLLSSMQASSSYPSSYTVSNNNEVADFSTIGEAISQAPSHRDTRFTIFVGPGIYKERLIIPPEKTNIFLIGAGLHNTVIVAHHYGVTLSQTATVGTYPFLNIIPTLLREKTRYI